MKTYNYQVHHTVGNASGTIEAANKTEAKKLLTEQYVSTFIDGEGKKQTVKIKSIVLGEVA